MRVLPVIVKRSFQLVCLLLLVALASFILSSLIPGDYFTRHQFDPTIQREPIERMRERYGLGLPAHVQYFRWLANLARLDLGYSLFYRTPVREVVFRALNQTLWIGIPALMLGISSGLCLGTLRAVARDRPLGHFMDLFSTIALSAPSLVLGLGAMSLAARTHWFPLGSMNSAQISQPGFLPWFIDRLHHLALPVICLTVPIMAAVERVQFASALEFLHEPYLSSALARGLGKGSIFRRYLLKPALNPIISTSGPMIGLVLSGSLVLEILFAWPGLGQVTYDALFNRDLYLVIGCVVGSGLLLVAGNLGSDLLLYAFDPRVRGGGR